jgi:hypothetical protein
VDVVGLVTGSEGLGMLKDLRGGVCDKFETFLKEIDGFTNKIASSSSSL